MIVKGIEIKGKLVELKIGETYMSVDKAREMAKEILAITNPTSAKEFLVHELARAIYPRCWDDHGAFYQPNTAISIAKAVVQKMRQSGYTLVKLRRGDIPA